MSEFLARFRKVVNVRFFVPAKRARLAFVRFAQNVRFFSFVGKCSDTPRRWRGSGQSLLRL